MADKKTLLKFDDSGDEEDYKPSDTAASNQPAESNADPS